MAIRDGAFEQGSAIQGPTRSSLVLTAIGRLARHRLGAFGLIILSGLVLLAALAPLLAPHDPTRIYYEAVLSPPSWRFPLGTDEIGRDVLSRIVYGARVTVLVVSLSISAAVVLGTAIGLVVGFYGGLIDDVTMRIMDGLQAFPMLILALAVVAILGPDLINAIIAIAIVNVPGFARLVRAQALSLRSVEFVKAAVSLGASDLRIMRRHLLPSIVGNLIVYASLRGSAAIITESSLAFLGLGVRPPTPSWGLMLSFSIEYMPAWWLGVFPGLAIFLVVLGLNFLGDGLRDVLDSRLDH